MKTSLPGQHIVASFFDNHNDKAMVDATIMEQISKVVEQNGLQIIRTTQDSFGPGMGYTAMIVLAESHVSIHTWPEYARVDLDLFTCNVSNDNRFATENVYKAIKEIFKPGKVTENFITRGQSGPYWGFHLALNFKSCDKDKIRSKEYIEHFTKDLCDFIDMERFGEPVVVNFGEDESVSGYSMFQLIETSNISAHFVEQTNDVYLDIFSCKPYNIKDTIQFCKEQFEAQDYNHVYLQRQA